MAEVVRGDAGGISGLLELIDGHREAVEYDLIALGLRLSWLGSELLTWRDLLVIVRQSPVGCAVHRALEPDTYRWDLPAQLMALIADILETGNWQRAGDPDAPRPEPLPRSDEVVPAAQQTALSLDEAMQRLGWGQTEGVMS